MRIAGTVIGIVFILIGSIWTLQGANILKGSAVMSGQSQWMWIGLAVIIAGIVTIWWTYRRRS